MICTKKEMAEKYNMSITLSSLLIDRINAPRVNYKKPYKYDVSWFHLNEILKFLKSRDKKYGCEKIIKNIEKELNK